MSPEVLALSRPDVVAALAISLLSGFLALFVLIASEHRCGNRYCPHERSRQR